MDKGPSIYSWDVRGRGFQPQSVGKEGLYAVTQHVEATRSMEGQPLSQLEFEMIAGPQAPASARSAVAQLGVLQLQHRIDDVQLAISEVVTNAVRYGGLRPEIDPVRVTVRIGENVVKFAVEQSTAAEDLEVQEPRGGPEPGGLGLRLVDQVADDWGYDPGPPGRVWFEFGRPS
jgi:anti-sigma regulatory factor (Ser/Thr protein kinase)